MKNIRDFLIILAVTLITGCSDKEAEVHAIIGVTNNYSGGEYSNDHVYKGVYITSKGEVLYRYVGSKKAIIENHRAWYSDSLNREEVDSLVDNSEVITNIDLNHVNEIKSTVSKLSKYELDIESVCYHYPPTIRYFALQFDEATGKYKPFLLKQGGGARVVRNDVNYDQLVETLNNVVESSNLDLDLCKEDSECC